MALASGPFVATVQQERTRRSLVTSHGLRGGSHLGKGQAKAADYVLVPDPVSQDGISDGNDIICSRSAAQHQKTAGVTLTIIDLRSPE